MHGSEDLAMAISDSDVTLPDRPSALTQVHRQVADGESAEVAAHAPRDVARDPCSLLASIIIGFIQDFRVGIHDP